MREKYQQHIQLIHQLTRRVRFMMNDSIDISIANKKLNAVLELCREILCDEAIAEVVHYIAHDEPEIAFEGLFIELMQQKTMPDAIIKKDCLALGQYLKLDSESVLDPDFWKNFIIFLE